MIDNKVIRNVFFLNKWLKSGKFYDIRNMFCDSFIKKINK